MKRSHISNKSQSFHSISIDDNDSLVHINKVGFEPTDHTPTQYDLENDKKIHIQKELQSAILPHGWQSIFDQILGKSSKQELKFTDFLPNKINKQIFTFTDKNIITKNYGCSLKKINNAKSLRNSFRFTSREELKIVNEKIQSRQISPSANQRARQDSKLVVPQKQQHNLKQNLMIFKKKPSKYTELSTNSQKSSQGKEQNQSFIPSSKVSSQSIQFDSIKEINKTMDISYIRRKSCYCSQCGDLNQFQFKSSNLQTQVNQKGRIRIVRSMKKSVTCGSQSKIVHKSDFVDEKRTFQQIITRPSILENVSPVDDTISPLRFDKLRSYNKIILPNMKDNLIKRDKAHIKSKFRSQKINIIINDPIIAVKQPKINRQQMNGYFISQIKGKSLKQLQTVKQILEPQRMQNNKNNKYSYSNHLQSVKSQMETYKQLNKQMSLTSSSYLTNIYTPKSLKSSLLYPSIQPYSLNTLQSSNVLSKIQQKLLSQLNQNNSPNKQYIPKLQVLKGLDSKL